MSSFGEILFTELFLDVAQWVQWSDLAGVRGSIVTIPLKPEKLHSNQESKLRAVFVASCVFGS